MNQILPINPAVLDSITAFTGLPPAVLAWLARVGEMYQYANGEVIAVEGSPVEFLLAVVQGSIHNWQHDGQVEISYRIDATCVGGVLPYSRLKVFPAQGVAAGDTVVYFLPRCQFAALEQVSPELVQRLVAIMNDRARDEVRTQERDEKLRALGKLSAGLSHELNNPAAAISRASASQVEMLSVLPALLLEMVATAPPAEALAAVTALALQTNEARPLVSALQMADLEEELADWLESQGCADGYSLTTSLLEANLTVALLEPVANRLPAPARPTALTWLSKHLSFTHLANDISEASRRISTLVGDVKMYSHMDRAVVREKLEVTSGIDSTLNMFAYALRQKNVRLTRHYEPDLPPVMGQVSSLNQVWTNLLDNAVDALPTKGGELQVSVFRNNNCVCVRIRDNGSGITPDVLTHMFEPFYTTKPLGVGSGQGLSISRRIVQEQGGKLEATSEPGRTEFTTWLPVA